MRLNYFPLLLLVLFAVPAEGDTVTLYPVLSGSWYDQGTQSSSPRDGTFDVLLPNYLYVGNAWDNGEYRAVLEFDLSSIPAGSTVTSVVLDVWNSGANPYSAADFLYGYTGDGVVTLDDVIVDNKLPLAGPKDPIDYEDVTAFLQSLVSSNAAHAGFMLRDDNLDSFRDYYPYNPDNLTQSPQLVVSFSETAPVPEPSTLLRWSSLGVIGAVMAYRRRRRSEKVTSTKFERFGKYW